MRIFSNIARWVFVLCLPVLLITASIAWAVNSLWLYKYGFYKYNVSRTTGLSQSEMEKSAAGLISYFNSDEDYINLTVVKDGKPLTLFNQQEIIHLKDVKGLIHLDYRVLLGVLLYMLAVVGASLARHRRKYWQLLAPRLAWGSSITLGLMLMLGLGTLLNFDQLFWQFHIISFTNELWQLDPARDYLIMLFPQGFWFDATLFCALTATTLSLIIGGASVCYLRLKRNRDAAD